MKKLMLVIIGAAMLVNCQAGILQKSGEDQQTSNSPKGSMTIAGTPDLYDLASRWAADYSAVHPKMKIQVVRLTGSGYDSGTDMAFVPGDYSVPNTAGSTWKMIIGRDAIVPVFNTANPYISEILSQGISAEEFSAFIGNPEKRTWSVLLKGGQIVPVRFYVIGNPSMQSSIASFAGISSGKLNGTVVSNGAEMISAIRNDPNAIGFCKLTDVTDPSGRNLVSQIGFLPIDKNGNGKLDYIEKIYANVDDISRGIWIGKYPQALSRNIYAIAPVKPTRESEVAFLKYVLTDGQPILSINGFNSLNNSERLSKIDRLPVSILQAQTSHPLNLVQLIITILAGMAIVIAILALRIRYRKNYPAVAANLGTHHSGSIRENSLNVPKGIWFDKTHTWAFMEKDGTVKVGIDDFLQHVTGTITGLKTKKPGDKVKKGEHILTIIQKGKRLNISAPLSGIIITENPNLFADSSLLNSSPYQDGWVYRIEPSNWSRENQFLFMAEKYNEWIRNEFSRLRDFLAGAIQPNDPEYAFAILQDGGEIADNLLENLGPEIWDDFQTHFIDTSK
jgi:glycine cleavage system H lipoate-binding protein/ABC-type phosphate transport system substrate-binding protein